MADPDKKLGNGSPEKDDPFIVALYFEEVGGHSGQDVVGEDWADTPQDEPPKAI